MILAIESAVVSALASASGTAHIPAFVATSSDILPEEAHIVVDASGMQMGPGTTAFGEIRVRLSDSALAASSLYAADHAALWALFSDSASVAAAWDSDDIDWIGGKLNNVASLAEDNRWVSEFSVTAYVKA